MSLIVEDGTGLATAESYISVVNATTYHSNRGNAAWAALASDAVREQYLRQATDYMVQAYRELWKGYRLLAAQALDWPRQDVCYDELLNAYVANNVVPTEVKNACASLALTAASGALAPDLGRGVLSEQIGPISVTYDKGSAEYTRYRSIDLALGPYLRLRGASAPLIRS